MAETMGPGHVLPVRVYYEDTDAGGVVYYAGYLRFAERGRTEMMRDIGFESSALLRDQGLALAVRRLEVDYFSPARLDDRLQIVTGVADVRGASLSLRQTIRRDDRILVDMKVKLACMNLAGGAARLPDEIRAAFARFCPDGTDNSVTNQ